MEYIIIAVFAAFVLSTVFGDHGQGDRGELLYKSEEK